MQFDPIGAYQYASNITHFGGVKFFRARRSKYFPSAARQVALILPWGEITNSFDPAIIPEAVSSKFQFFSGHQKIYYIASAMMGTYTLFKFGKNMNL
jgi:hypothetical protein